ncbi:hypothetical protein [[Phormidium] sp. ETS-05]|uniref:hypothetical protein n=1 Tax=[Phormidium] sp. ETS-05 TaxID=222819 RepID=UPI001E2A7279|nr:hypothetical protein [[Phormidium] sp. ETS-05]
MTQTVQTTKWQFHIPTLPLAVYREIEAHIRQVKGVRAGLTAQTSPDFDYLQSQVAHLWLELSPETDPAELQRLQQILDYYCQRYGTGSANYLQPVGGSNGLPLLH